MSEIIKKLPTVLQTTPEKKFFDATFDQVFSKKDSEYLAGFLGRKVPGQFKPDVDYYIPEPSKNRTSWQLEPAAYSRNQQFDKTNVVFYEDLLDRIAYYGGNIGNHARLFDSEYYSWAPPIDYDMFVNYQNYYWVTNIPVITINGVRVEDINGREYYFIPGTEERIKLTTGMVILLPDDPFGPDVEYFVEFVDGVIRLVKKHDIRSASGYRFLPWDGTRIDTNGEIVVNTEWDDKTWEVEEFDRGDPQYITIGRGSVDQNIWSRKNRWIHVDTLHTILAYTGSAWPTGAIRGSRPIIQYDAGLELYRSGTRYVGDVKYAFTNKSDGTPVSFNDIDSHPVEEINSAYNIRLARYDLVILTRDSRTPGQWLSNGSTDPRLTSYIFRVSINNDGVVTLSPINGWLSPVNVDDVVYTTTTVQYGGTSWESWHFSTNGWQYSYNNGLQLSTGPWFQLYDYAGVRLDDTSKYPESSFTGGSKIFSYMVNPTPGATVDPVLKFPIVYRSSGQSSDIVFENYLITERHTYRDSLSPIDGYYYYHVIGDPVHKNGWELFTLDKRTITNSSPLTDRRSKQRVIDKVAIDGSTYQFKLSATPELVAGTKYVSDVTINGITVPDARYTYTTINGVLYIDLSLLFNNTTWVNDLPNPVLEVATYTTEVLDDDAYGYFEIPQQLEANPLQEEVGVISGSEVMEHFASIIRSQPGFTGEVYGPSNNYKDSIKNKSLGKRILQNMTPMLKSMLVTSDTDLDIIAAIRYAQDEYTKFKNRYISTAEQLIKNEFSPVEYHNNKILIGQWVDEILKTVNVSKEFSKAFAYSYMVASGTPSYIETRIPATASFMLDNYVDLSKESNTLYVYDKNNNERLLLKDIDYLVTTTDGVIEIELLTPSLVGQILTVVLFKDMPYSYIPSTPSKLGMAPVYIPRIETDYTYAEPADVLVGHDGSRTIVFGDYRDQLLLELEIRIYNSINRKFRTEYMPPVHIEQVKSGFFRQTDYQFSEFLDISEQSLNKWCVRNRANFRVNEWALNKGAVPANQLWKLYNYARAEDKDGNKLGLPGHWKGIFQYLYDTVYPDTKPWQMLGFSEKPAWWEAEYGPGIRNSNGEKVWVDARMWDDLEAGIIRRGPRSIVNPYNGHVLPQYIWARPGLENYIPVDTSGNLRSVIDIFNLSVTNNPAEPFDGYDSEWEYGDGGPVEQAWKSTSSYNYNLQEFLFLMKPAAYSELHWDTLGTEFCIGRIGSEIDYHQRPRSYFNYQYVQNDLYESSDMQFSWMRPKNRTQVVHAEQTDGSIASRLGYQQWISDRILFHGKNVSEVFGLKVRTLNVNLASKLSGFTNKDTVNTYIESVSVQSNTRTLGVPSTNFQVMLHRGQPVNSYSYSGVIIRALADGTFGVYGYDLLNSQFTVLDRNDTKAIDVTVGGTPSEFKYFEFGESYRTGDIIRYNGVYYTARYDHIAVTFNTDVWQKLPALPIVGGISVTYRPDSKPTFRKYSYGTVFGSVQDVFDFLIGWGAYLESQGWRFDLVNTDTNQISDWLYSAKQFLFWLNTSWAPDSTIQLSPLATQATLTVSRGYPNNIELISNGVYSILDKRGMAIPVDKTVTERDGRTITVRTTDASAGGIYFLQVNSTETEHILIFDNQTDFNDLVYSPLLRTRQDRIRFNGFRSKSWYGKMEAPGYLINGDKLIPNYDTLISDMRYYYDPDTAIDNPNLEELGRRLIGFERKQYLDNLQVSNDTQYLFYQGMIREKGTAKSLDKLFRTSLVNTNENIEIFEEWALKVGDIGNVVGHVSTEFILDPEQYTGDTMVARMMFKPATHGGLQEVKILDATSRYKTVPVVHISPPDGNPYTSDTVRPFELGDTYRAGDVVLYKDQLGGYVYYRSLVLQTPDRFVDENWERLPDVRIAKAYAVLDRNGYLSRIDVTDTGFGYSGPPTIEIRVDGVASEDVVYGVWRGESIVDEIKDNIVSIDIDSDEQWVVRPNEPGISMSFPTTATEDFDLPNAGYVNLNDVDWSTFDINSAVVNWGVGDFNPSPYDTIWIAKTFTEDWGVYKLAPYQLNWRIVRNEDDQLQLLLDASNYLGVQGSTKRHRTDLGNLICLQSTDSGKSVPTSNYAVAIDPEVSIFIDIDTDTAYNAYTLVSLDGTPLTANELGDYSTFDTLSLFRSLRWSTTPAKYRIPVYVGLGDYIWVDSHAGGGWAVLKTAIKPGRWDIYKWGPEVPEYYGMGYTEPSVHAYGWDTEGPMWLDVHRKQEPLIDTARFKNASVYAGKDGNTLVQLPVYDPFKGIIPGPAKQNISYISASDPARYNVTPDQRLYTDRVEFLDDFVGKLWWDLTNTRYMYYEQPAAQSGEESLLDNLRYRRDYWGRLFPGSVVDIYEWVKSPVPPSEYSGTGIPRDISSFIQVSYANIYTGVVNYNYYFWVKNSTTKPGVANRTLTALEVATLLQSTRIRGNSFFAPIQQTDNSNSYMFFNVQDILSSRGRNVRIEYNQSDNDTPPHAQWALFRENDVTSEVRDNYWERLIDSICGFTQEFETSRPPKSAVKLPNGKYTIPVPDTAFSTYERYGVRSRPTQTMFVDLYMARKIFVQSLNSILTNLPIRDTRSGWDTGITSKYWTYITWYKPGYETARPTRTANTLTDAYLLAGLRDGDIIEVLRTSRSDGTTRFSRQLVKTVNGSVTLTEIAIQDSAVRLLDTVYTSRNLYDLSVELRSLLQALRKHVFIDDYYIYRNVLFSSMLNYVLSEQKTPDWVFKTSMITIREGEVNLTQDRMFVPNQVEDIIDYITDTKPYHTHVREYKTVYRALDTAKVTALDSLHSKITIGFNPGPSIFTPPGWDTFNWDMYGWEKVYDEKVYDEVRVDGNTYYDHTVTGTDVVQRVLGTNPLLTTDIGLLLESDAFYAVDITAYDGTKVGASNLVPYTFTIGDGMVPGVVIGITDGDDILYQGKDFFVKQHTDKTYTAYLYNVPKTTSLRGYIWIDGGEIITQNHPTYRSEYAFGYPIDTSIFIVDTQLALENDNGTYYALGNWGYHWSSLNPESMLSKIIRKLNGITAPYSIDNPLDPTNIKWDRRNSVIDGELELVDYFASYRQDMVSKCRGYMRNATEYSGILIQDLERLGRPDSDMPADQSNEHIQTIRIYVDPTQHAYTDILPDPSARPGVIWVDGERIAYLKKDKIAQHTWEISLLQRGMDYTTAMRHASERPSKLTSGIEYTSIFVETNNLLPPNAAAITWQALGEHGVPLYSSMIEPDKYTSISNQSDYGMWYSATQPAQFIVDKPGRAIT